MSIILDIIILLILGLSIYMGYKKGLVNVIFKMITFFLALIISFVIYNPVANFIIDNTNVDENIKTFIEAKLDNEEEVNAEDLNTSKVVENYVKTYTEEIKNNGIESISKELSIVIVKVAVFITIFIIARILLFFVKIFANILTILPLIKECNQIGGFIYGIARGMIIVWTVLAIASIVLPMTNSVAISNGIEHSYVTKTLYDYNLLLMVLF